MAVNVDTCIHVIFWHDVFCELGIIELLNRARLKQRLPANWTIQAVLQVLIEAALVQVVRALKEYDTFSTDGKILKAYSTALLEQVLLAFVIRLDR